MTQSIEITGYRPGVLGRIVEMHGTYYSREWGLGLYFETKVARELADFLQRMTDGDGIWVAHVDDMVAGAVVIDGHDGAGQGARLRWFILDDGYRGLGLGSALMQSAMDHCRAQGFARVWLSTFSGLVAARHLYERHGFRLYAESDATHLTGNPALTEQLFEWMPA